MERCAPFHLQVGVTGGPASQHFPGAWPRLQRNRLTVETVGLALYGSALITPTWHNSQSQIQISAYQANCVSAVASSTAIS